MPPNNVDKADWNFHPEEAAIQGLSSSYAGNPLKDRYFQFRFTSYCPETASHGDLCIRYRTGGNNDEICWNWSRPRSWTWSIKKTYNWIWA